WPSRISMTRKGTVNSRNIVRTFGAERTCCSLFKGSRIAWYLIFRLDDGIGQMNDRLSVRYLALRREQNDGVRQWACPGKCHPSIQHVPRLELRWGDLVGGFVLLLVHQEITLVAHILFLCQPRRHIVISIPRHDRH